MKLIVLEGPTASGKTALGVALAQRLNTVVISADSRQFYKELSIGTAKPSKEEMNGVPHYFIDSHSIYEPLTSGQFEVEAMECITEQLQHLPVVLLVGGSGMFVDALVKGLDPLPTDSELQQKLRLQFEQDGLSPLLQQLEEKDPVYFEQVDKNNPSRILRALEVIELTGKPFSEQRQNTLKQRPFEAHFFHIDLPRELLYERINLRVDMMVEAGLFEEALMFKDVRHLSTLQTVGYTEVYDFTDGKYSKEEAIDKIKQNTRNYAKRQLTWIRRRTNSHAISALTTENRLNELLETIRNQGLVDLE